ncbi:hypothetical protein VHEMI01892 [[Torrubiella] hemipterigena]|uniref:Zn(2)-C6 fungal-type domain-containing protein n=1 Tax=[Torrubiella] hemipterigena TaxID=1531966 RepID=A0A0A1SU87_9HYPO|nr:hypothetical protein VHEMI01892 [[Torrubiella] hemipterigena]
MFATWKFDQETSEIQSIRQTYDPVSARSNQHQACDRCHEKKLKCSGDKSGCNRCVASSFKCEYNRGESRRRKRSTKRSLTINVDRQGHEASLSSPGSNYASSVALSPASSATSFQSCMSRKGSQSFCSPSQSHTSLASVSNAVATSPTSYNFVMASQDNDLTPIATTSQTSSYMYPQAVQDTPEHAFYSGDSWAKGYPDVTTAALMQSTYVTAMPHQQQYLQNNMSSEYPPYNDYSSMSGQNQEAWQYCR